MDRKEIKRKEKEIKRKEKEIKRKAKEISRKIERFQNRNIKIRRIERELANLEKIDIEDVSELDFIPEPKPFEIEKKIIPPREVNIE